MLAPSVDQSDASTSVVSPAQKTKEQVQRHSVRTLNKAIDESDIVILVLDACDPEGCRSRLVEEEVRRRESEGKKLVFVLNKIGARAFFFSFLACVDIVLMVLDLVPRENAQQWLRYHDITPRRFRSVRPHPTSDRIYRERRHQRCFGS